MSTAPVDVRARRVYWLFVAALLIALTVPRMAQRGMFGDGLLYAVVARNLSLGVGSFWSLSYSTTIDPEWFEHPPLALGLQALAFRLLGDHLYVERLYSLLTFATTAALIVAVWRRLAGRDLEWLPLFFWLLPSVVTWSVINNMLENTQAVFSTAAVLLVIAAIREGTAGRAAIAGTAAGVCVAAAVLTKGPVGFFPLAVPALTWIWSPRPAPRRVLLVSAAAVGALAVVATAVLASPDARHALSEYLHGQVIASLQGRRETNADPIAAFRHLGLGIAARMAVVAAVLWLAAGRPRAVAAAGTRAFFFLVALAASVPIAISPKLAGHYFLASVPFYALAFAASAHSAVATLVARSGRLTRGVLTALAATLLLASAIVPFFRTIEPRDVGMVRNLDAVAGAIPRRATIGTCPQDATNWGLHSYVSRFFNVFLLPEGRPVNGWLLTLDHQCTAPPACQIAAAGDRLTLFRCE